MNTKLKSWSSLTELQLTKIKGGNGDDDDPPNSDGRNPQTGKPITIKAK